MTRDISQATQKDLKKKGLTEYFNYRPNAGDERKFIEAGIMKKVNKVLQKEGLVMVMQGEDRENFYLFRIVKK